MHDRRTKSDSWIHDILVRPLQTRGMIRIMSRANKPTYDELKALCDGLQRQITHFLVVKQDLIDTRNSLDRDLARFKAIQSYSQKVIHAGSLQDFAEITVESIIEAFELECSALAFI